MKDTPTVKLAEDARANAAGPVYENPEGIETLLTFTRFGPLLVSITLTVLLVVPTATVPKSTELGLVVTFAPADVLRAARHTAIRN